MSGQCVLYITSSDQPSVLSELIISAQARALSDKTPLAIVCCLPERLAVPRDAKLIHKLSKTEQTLNRLGIPFIILYGQPSETLNAIIHHTKPVALYFNGDPRLSPFLLPKAFFKDAEFSYFVSQTKTELAMSATEGLVSHPYSWPGKVLKVSDLIL